MLERLLQLVKHSGYLTLACLPAHIAFRRLCRLEVTGADRVSIHPNLLVVSNHRSLVDSWLVIEALFNRPQDVVNYAHLPWHPAAVENFLDTPAKRLLFGGILKCLPVRRHRSDPDVLATLDKLVDALRTGTMIYFPEGTRTRTGHVSGQARWGVGYVIQRTQPVVVPVFHRGSEQVLPVRRTRLSFGHPLEVRVGKPIDFGPLLESHPGPATWQAIADRVLDEIRALEAEVCGTPPTSRTGLEVPPISPEPPRSFPADVREIPRSGTVSPGSVQPGTAPRAAIPAPC